MIMSDDNNSKSMTMEETLNNLSNERVIELKSKVKTKLFEGQAVKENRFTQVSLDKGDKEFSAKHGLSDEELQTIKLNLQAEKKEETKQREPQKVTQQGQSELKKDHVKVAGRGDDKDDKTIEAERVGDKHKKPIPSELNNKYRIEGDNEKGKYYFKESPDVVAFKDKGAKLVTKSTATSVATSMVALAEAKNWESIKLSGSKKFKQEVWMEASLRGMEVSGYKPSEQDLQNLANRQNKIENAGHEGTNETLKTPTNTTKVENEKTNEPVAKPIQSSVKTSADAQVSNVSEPKKPELSGEDKKVIEIRDRLHKEDRANGSTDVKPALSAVDQNVLNIQVKLDKEAKGDSTKSDSQPLHERSKKDELRKAYSEMSRKDAIQKHPELEPLYNLEKAASQFVNHEQNKGKFDSKGKESFISSVREKALDTLDRGGKLPTLRERVVETSRPQEKEAEVQR